MKKIDRWFLEDIKIYSRRNLLEKNLYLSESDYCKLFNPKYIVDTVIKYVSETVDDTSDRLYLKLKRNYESKRLELEAFISKLSGPQSIDLSDINKIWRSYSDYWDIAHDLYNRAREKNDIDVVEKVDDECGKLLKRLFIEVVDKYFMGQVNSVQDKCDKTDDIRRLKILIDELKWVIENYINYSNVLNDVTFKSASSILDVNECLNITIKKSNELIYTIERKCDTLSQLNKNIEIQDQESKTDFAKSSDVNKSIVGDQKNYYEIVKAWLQKRSYSDMGIISGILLASISGAYYLYKKYWQQDCSQLSGLKKIECEVNLINKVISNLEKSKKKCKKSGNQKDCKKEFDLLINKWNERKQQLLSSD